jgi:hypothetical protein
VLEAADLDVGLAWDRKVTVACRAPVEVRPFFCARRKQPSGSGNTAGDAGLTATDECPLDLRSSRCGDAISNGSSGSSAAIRATLSPIAYELATIGVRREKAALFQWV